MKNRKISVNLTEDNYKKIKKLSAETGRTQTELINSAIGNVPIVVLGNQKNIAETFFDLHKAVTKSNVSSVQKEALRACQCLNTLMARIEALMPSEKV